MIVFFIFCITLFLRWLKEVHDNSTATLVQIFMVSVTVMVAFVEWVVMASLERFWG